MARTPEHRSWASMLRRCFDQKQKGYERYGGRGITVCEARRDFREFYKDMGARQNGTTIDRIDNDANYSCGRCSHCIANGWQPNCRWANRVVQVKNKSNSVIFTHEGISDNLVGWGNRVGINPGSIKKRLALGWSFSDAIGRKIDIHTKVSIRKFTCKGESLTIPEWAKKSGISASCLANRLSSGMTIEQSLSMPYRKIGPRIKAD